jgi:hypothetical protein
MDVGYQERKSSNCEDYQNSEKCKQKPFTATYGGITLTRFIIFIFLDSIEIS